MANNFLVELLAGTIESIGESKLVEVLQKCHDKNPATFATKVKALHEGLAWLQPEVEKSKTKIDDAVLKALLEALETSASTNGVTL